jgi:hypothetical protein
MEPIASCSSQKAFWFSACTQNVLGVQLESHHHEMKVLEQHLHVPEAGDAGRTRRNHSAEFPGNIAMASCGIRKDIILVVNAGVATDHRDLERECVRVTSVASMTWRAFGTTYRNPLSGDTSNASTHSLQAA